jgi:hypothetical protein
LEIRKIKEMSEVINHICGTCGENHPHIFNFSALLVGVAGYFTYIKSIIKTKIQLWKRK